MAATRPMSELTKNLFGHFNGVKSPDRKKAKPHDKENADPNTADTVIDDTAAPPAGHPAQPAQPAQQPDLLRGIKQLLDAQTTQLEQKMDNATRMATEALQLARSTNEKLDEKLQEVQTAVDTKLEDLKKDADVLKRNAATANLNATTANPNDTDLDPLIVFAGGWSTDQPFADSVEATLNTLPAHLRPGTWWRTARGAILRYDSVEAVKRLLREWRALQVQHNGARIWLAQNKSRYERSRDTLVSKVTRAMHELKAGSAMGTAPKGDYRSSVVRVDVKLLAMVDKEALRLTMRDADSDPSPQELVKCVVFREATLTEHQITLDAAKQAVIAALLPQSGRSD